MTDTSGPLARDTIATLGWGASWSDTLAALLPAPERKTITLLTASLAGDDPLLAAVRSLLEAEGVEANLVLPARSVAPLIRRESGWIPLRVMPPDLPPYLVRLPDRLIGGAQSWVVTDVDRVRRRGPYALDLVARYLHPVDRLRLLASRERTDVAVEVNLAWRPGAFIIGKRCEGLYVAALAADPIAAELLALALADEDLSPREAAAGPWEDRVVQRATELDLGIQVPDQLSIRLAGTPGEAVQRLVERVAGRIGVSML